MSDISQFHIHMNDYDIADIIVRSANPNSHSVWRHAVETAVASGRAIGKREPLEPLDDGLRTVIEGALEIVRKRDPGMIGLIHNLERLDQWLQRYPCRGRPVDDGEPA